MSLIKKNILQFNGTQNSISQLYGQSFANTFSGEPVDEYSALGISTVLGCASLLADSVAAMPLKTFKMVGGKKVTVDLPVVLQSPDPESNTYEMIHQFVLMMALHGNSYSFLSRDKYQNVIGITNLHPYQMQVMPDATMNGRQYRHLGEVIPSDQILHLRWYTPPQSLTGISPINQSRNLLGLALAMDRHLAQFYGEGAIPSGILTQPGKLTRDQADIVKENWTASHRRHRKTAVLSDGMTYQPITTSAADQQMIQTKEQLVRDIARIFRIPSHLIGSTGDNQTYMNVEQASLNFLIHSIQPYLVRIEAALSTILPDGINVEFDTSSILRADALSRAKVNLLNVQMGARNPNEVRAVEGLDPYVGGEVFNQSLAGATTAGGVLPSLGEEQNPPSTPTGSVD